MQDTKMKDVGKMYEWYVDFICIVRFVRIKCHRLYVLTNVFLIVENSDINKGNQQNLLYFVHTKIAMVEILSSAWKE